MEENTSFGYWLRRRRRALDLTQQQLAAAAGCAVATVKKIEADERRPSRQLAERLIDCLAIPAEDRDALLQAARRVQASEELPTFIDVLTALPPTTLRCRPLPRPLTPFVGRARELAELVPRLGDPAVRLLTLVAPGGMGKTRLALAAANHLQTTGVFPNGVAFVALDPLSDPAHLETTLADALGLPLTAGGPRSPRTQLLDFLREKRLLLILDNCEHLREGVAELASAILTAAPGVTLLTTSRERLGLRVEQPLPVDSMVSAEDGVQLFLLTAQVVQPAFVLDDTTRAQAAAICAQVAGMPLAIELAAGWADTLSLPEIAAELARGDALLVSAAPDLLPRHRSVRAVCDSTWQRLTLEEQAVFAQVAVFRGGGTRRALQAVSGASLPVLQALVGKALLRYDAERDRYTVHELLRQYAQERLDADPTAARQAYQRHAAYYLTAVAAQEADLQGALQQAALDKLRKDNENVTAAWAWASDHHVFDLLAAAAASLRLAYEWLGQSAQGLVAFERAAVASRATGPPALTATLLAAQAHFQYLRGDQPGALDVLAHAQQLLAALSGDDPALNLARAQVFLQIGNATAYYDYSVAHAAYTRSQGLFDAYADRWSAATVQAGLGHLIINLSTDYALARQILEQSTASYRALGDRIGLCEGLIHLSVAVRYLHDFVHSHSIAQEAYSIAQATGNPRLVAQAASNLGQAMGWIGDNAGAESMLQTALTITHELGHQAELPNITRRLGTITASQGRYTEARAILVRGLELARRLEDPFGTIEHLVGMGMAALGAGADAEVIEVAAEAVALSEQVGEHWFRSLALALSAFAARRQDNQEQARAAALAALRHGVAHHIWLNWCLWAITLLLADQGDLERAAAVFALAERSTAYKNVWTEDIALREIAARLSTRPTVTRDAAQARGAARETWDAAAELISELEAVWN